LTEFPKEVQEKIDSIESTLREILKFTRFANISRLKEVLDRELDTDEKKIAYENSDGETILKELAAVSGAPSATVGAWWQKWFRMGIVSESEERGQNDEDCLIGRCRNQEPKEGKGQSHSSDCTSTTCRI